MQKCRYIPESDLPKTATDEEIDAILAALGQRRYQLIGSAARYVTGPWDMTARAFIAAIQAHLNAGCRLFYKHVQSPPPNTLLFSANVGRDPDSNDEEKDVYVEIRLKHHTVAILCNAHNHPRSEPRLPK